MDNLDRLISIIIYADIVGYSSMMQEDENQALLKLKHFEEVIKLQSKKYDGEIVKAYGDGCLIIFTCQPVFTCSQTAIVSTFTYSTY